MPITLRRKKEDDVEEYYPEGEDPEDSGATCFLVKDLKPKERAKITDGLAEMDDDGNVSKVKSQTITIELVEERIVGWRNIYDADGEPIEYEDISVEELLWMMPDETEQELYSEFGLAEGQGDDEEDEK